MHDNLKRMLMEAVVVCFKAVYKHLPGLTEENFSQNRRSSA